MQEDLKIKIGVDTKQVERDLKGLEKIEPKINIDTILKIKNKNEKIKEIKELQKEIQLIKINPNSFPDGELKKLNQQLKKAKEELKGMKAIAPKNLFKESYEEAKRLAEKVKQIKLNPKNFSSQDIKLLRSEIEATALKAKAINFAEGTSKSQGLINNLTTSSKELDKISGQVGYTNKMFSTMDIAIGNIAANLTMKVLGVLKNITLEGAKFNQQMEFATEKIRTISSSSGAEINSNIWRIAKSTGVNPLELKEGLYQVVSAIGDTYKKYALLETANKLATTGFSSTAEAVDGLTTVLNAYNLAIDDAERVANIFVRTQKVGKLTVQEFQQQLYKTVPIAKELGITIDEIGASIALLTAKGSKAEVAQTQMAAFMYELLDTGSDVNKLFTRLAGQSIDTYVKNGGNLEGILRTLKEYSNQSGFKIESLFGRKEAKSFWLNIGNDIDGFLQKLKAINDPINEVQRNFDNLLNTQEKRLDRANVYWMSLKQSIGAAAGELLATVGDFVTGADTETAARQRLNNELDDSLKTLDELSKKQSLTAEEQNTLNKTLQTLELLAPSVAEAYKNWAFHGGEYKTVLEEIHRAQNKVNQEASKISLKAKENEVKALRSQQLDVMTDLGFKSEFHRKHREYYEETGEISKETFDDYLEEKAKKIRKKIASGKPGEKELKFVQNYNAYKDTTNKLVKAKKELTDMEEKIKNDFINQTNGKETTLSFLKESPKEKLEEERIQSKDNKVNPTEEKYKTKQQIEANTSRILIEEQRKYAEQLSKLTSSDFEGKSKLDEAYRDRVEAIKRNGKIEKLELEKNEIKEKTRNEKDTTILDKAKTEIEEIDLKIQDLIGEGKIAAEEKRIDNTKKSEDERKKQQEKEKRDIEKRHKEKQLRIDTEYNKKMLEATKKYNEDMAALKGNGAKEEIEAVKKAYEQSKEEIEFSKKKQTLENSRDNTFYSTEVEKNANTEAIVTEIALMTANKDKTEQDKERERIQKENTEALEKMSRNLKNLSNMFQTIGDNTKSESLKTLSNITNIGTTIFDALKGTEQGANMLGKVFGDKAIPGFEDFTMAAGVGSAVTGVLGGGVEGNIGSLAGSGIGLAFGGPVGAIAGSVLGSTIGSLGGNLFGRKSKKKKKREERKRKEAQGRLKRGLISGQYKWADVLEVYNEDLARLGAGSYINLYDKVQANTNYDTNLSALEGAKVGHDGISMSTLKQLLPQYNEQQIIDWFKSITGGAVLNGDTISTGEGKYGAIDIAALAQQVTNVNRELEKSLKETIKGIIDFSADSLAQVVKNGFFNGIDDLGNNIEKMLANSLKNAFINTEISKALFKGMSDKVSETVKDMFKNDANLGIQLETGSLENLTLTQYIELIKKYMEASNEKLEDLFKELGMNMDNLTNSVDSLNKNMSKNTVQGMATNLWKYNVGQKVTTEFNGTFEIPIILDGQVLDKRIIKVTSDSMRKARRNKF